MKNFTHAARVFLTLVFVVLLGGACSSPKYYVFKTIKHTPVEKTAVSQDQPVLNEKEPAAEVTETAVATTEKVAEAVNLNKVSRQIAAKAEPVARTQKISKLEEIKTAMQVKKEVKKIRKELEKQDLNQEVPGPKPKSQMVALLLAIFVGAIGIHRFYLGYTAIGIIQLLTLGGCGIWALIDLIRIAMNDLGPADGSPYDPTL